MNKEVDIALKEAPRPTTTEDLEREREIYTHFLEIMAWLCVPAFIILCILGIVLPYYFRVEAMPRFLRPFWNPYGIILVLGFVYTLAIRLSKYGRAYTKHVPLIRAIKAYDRGKEQYRSWQSRRTPQALINSYECVNNAAELLNGVQEFQDFKATVMKAYSSYFEQGRQ